jgi:4a-hydroxytetrahydrobiopterin dehydratase
VTVRLFTHDIVGLSVLDAQLARQIWEAAGTLEVEADPAAVQSVQLTIEALVTVDVHAFCAPCSLLGGRLHLGG